MIKKPNVMNALTMKAVVAHRYGGPEVLQVAQMPAPSPAPNEVLIKVHASAVTTADGMMRSGKPWFGRMMLGLRKPKHPIPGTGFAGQVQAAGAAVTRLQPGDRVFGETTLGFSTHAEYVTVPADGVLLPMPDALSYEEAATFCDGPITSLNFLKAVAQLRPGQHVLINGASGSLGTAAVQLAKHLGAEVTGVCSSRNVGLVRSLGADRVIDYSRQDFTQQGKQYDFIFDTVGKRSFRECKRALTLQGTYLSPVLSLRLLGQMLWSSRFGKQKAVFSATGLRPEEELRQLLQELASIYKAGKLKVVIDRQYPLEKIVEAHTYVASGHKRGNVILAIGL